MLTGYISNNFKIEKETRTYGKPELELTNKDEMYGITIKNEQQIDELIELLQSSKGLLKPESRS